MPAATRARGSPESSISRIRVDRTRMMANSAATKKALPATRSRARTSRPKVSRELNGIPSAPAVGSGRLQNSRFRVGCKTGGSREPGASVAGEKHGFPVDGIREEAPVVRPGMIVVAEDELAESLEMHAVVPERLHIVGVGQRRIIPVVRLS